METDQDICELLDTINQYGAKIQEHSDTELQSLALSVKKKVSEISNEDDYLVECYAIIREVAHRVLGMRPYDEQVLAGIAMHRGELVEMQTGEGKTLAAVFPAALNGFSGKGVHVLTFNSYLAQRDALWMEPIYRFMEIAVGVVTEDSTKEERRQAYLCDVTYLTAKELGFDFLREQLCRDKRDIVLRPFNFALVDEADSMLIEEARVPFVITTNRDEDQENLYQIATMIDKLDPEADFDVDENFRNIFLTDKGFDHVESILQCGDLHFEHNQSLLAKINQQLHAHVLLKKDVDYIVRGERIELVDEFTGRVVEDRRWPDGLQAALEAKENLVVQPGGRILGSITLQHLLKLYKRICGMTATAQEAAQEFLQFYGLSVRPISPTRPSIRKDMPDLIFTHKEAKLKALIDAIQNANKLGRPVLVGTASVDESEQLAQKLSKENIECQVLNARNNSSEAEIIAEAGDIGAVTISTNMAGRGTDIKLGGANQEHYEEVVNLGGLLVIGTTKHENQRIDNQLRGRAGRQGDPGVSQFYVSLEDDLLVRYGIESMLPKRQKLNKQLEPLEKVVFARAVDQLQRIVSGVNYEIRQTLWRYSSVVEKQRLIFHGWRSKILFGQLDLDIMSTYIPERISELKSSINENVISQAEKNILLHYIDQAWSEHLDYITYAKDNIHLLEFGGLDPINEFQKRITDEFKVLEKKVIDNSI